MAAQTLYGLLVRYGTEAADDEGAVRGLRYSVLHNSLLEHLKLVDAIAVKIIAFVLTYESPTSSRRASATQMQVPTGGRVSRTVLLRGETALPPSHPSSVSSRSELLSVIAAAQQTISAIHVRQPNCLNALFSANGSCSSLWYMQCLIT